jgi:hypothetical protein
MLKYRWALFQCTSFYVSRSYTSLLIFLIASCNYSFYCSYFLNYYIFASWNSLMIERDVTANLGSLENSNELSNREHCFIC